MQTINTSQNITPERIMQFAWGYAPTLIIEAALEHKVFDGLDKSARQGVSPASSHINRSFLPKADGWIAAFNSLLPDMARSAVPNPPFPLLSLLVVVIPRSQFLTSTLYEN